MGYCWFDCGSNHLNNLAIFLNIVNEMDIRINEWNKLKSKFIDPAKALPKWRQMQKILSSSNLSLKAKNFRTSKLKPYREEREATIFCYGIGKCLGTTVYVAKYEASDYDAISMRFEGDVQHFTPIQIKELVPKELNPETNINKEIAKLATGYPVSNDLEVVIHVNRPGPLHLSSIVVPKLNISGLWLLCASKPDQSEWFIVGNLLNNCRKPFYFDYPVN